MFGEYAEFVQSLDMVALRVECHLAEPAVSYQGLHFDSILSFAVVEEQTQGAMLPNKSSYVPVPLPLQALWSSPIDVPLYAATDLMPPDSATTDIRYWHRRAITPRMTTKSLRTTAGRHKEKRTAMPTINNDVLIADAIGNLDEVSRLLQFVTSIGKKRSTSGAVLHWKVYKIKEFALLAPDGTARRPIPVNVLSKINLDVAQNLAYSPPYWHPDTKWLCIPAGAPA